jgi:hypothetical protein
MLGLLKRIGVTAEDVEATMRMQGLFYIVYESLYRMLGGLGSTRRLEVV